MKRRYVKRNGLHNWVILVPNKSQRMHGTIMRVCQCCGLTSQRDKYMGRPVRTRWSWANDPVAVKYTVGDKLPVACHANKVTPLDDITQLIKDACHADQS